MANAAPGAAFFIRWVRQRFSLPHCSHGLKPVHALIGTSSKPLETSGNRFVKAQAEACGYKLGLTYWAEPDPLIFPVLVVHRSPTD